MEIKDLFSHKIHSSSDDWPNKLIDIASIFSEFDGKPYDRLAIEKRLSQISPRSSSVARDPSKFRDEISAYPAYLGLYRVELVNDTWHIFLSNSAKQFLVCEEPNVPAFMLLQMVIFQYPNGMGAAYKTNSNNVRIQSNTRNKTLNLISNNIHLSPLRLICKGLKADSEISGISPLEARLSLDEIFILANHPAINQSVNPSLKSVINILQSARNKKILPPNKYESRFHILKHTNFIISEKGYVRLRPALTNTDASELLKKLEIINSLESQFNAFDSAKNSEDLLKEIRTCSWGKYFDGVKSLESSVVSSLTHENPDIYCEFEKQNLDDRDFNVVKSNSIYKLKDFNFNRATDSSRSRTKHIYADPEITRIKRQRANLSHKILLERLYDYFINLGASPLENEHIDLYVELLNGNRFVFEVKSLGANNLLSQSRKGVSQLYEYRYRYQKIIGYDVNLFLVYPQEPTSIPWLQEYLCKDRQIGVIWFDEKGSIQFSTYCDSIAKSLINATA